MGAYLSSVRSGLIAILALVALGSVVGATPAQAQWLKAESPNFIVYSDGREAALRQYIRDLEAFDWLLRRSTGLPQQGAAARKLPIYLVSSGQDLRLVLASGGHGIGGFYTASVEDVFAVAVSDVEDDYVLHEYAHHFFSQNFPNHVVPGWLSEGQAEYYMTAEIRRDQISIGHINRNRAYVLLDLAWLPLEDLLGKRFRAIESEYQRNTYYPLSWLLTHWFISDPTRREQLRAYLADVGGGADPVEAMVRATGLSIDQLTTALQSYLRGRLGSVVFVNEAADPEITITRLPRSADDLLLLGQRVKIGVPDAMVSRTLDMVRTAASKHPDDPLALLVLGHAELHMGDAVEGERILLRLLEMEPDNVEALQLMASARLKQAQDRPEESRTLLNQARGFLARAYAVDPDNYLTLYYNALSREGADTYPNDNDIQTWEQAFFLVPQLSSVRLGYAQALILSDQRDRAIQLLTPLANAAHGGPAAEAAQSLIETTLSGGAPPSLEELEDDSAPDVPGEPQPDPEGQGEPAT